MFMHFPCICMSFHIFLLLWTVLELFWLSLSFLSLFLFSLVVSMARNCKSILARNPLHSGASSSFDHAPLFLHFHNDDAHKAFTENFSRWGIHSGMGVSLWRARHLSSCADSGVLLQYVRDWPFHTSFCYSCPRYFYSCHTVACCGCA